MDFVDTKKEAPVKKATAPAAAKVKPITGPAQSRRSQSGRYKSSGPDEDITAMVNWYADNSKIPAIFKMPGGANSYSKNYSLKGKRDKKLLMGTQSWPPMTEFFIDGKTHIVIYNRQWDIFEAHKHMLKDGKLNAKTNLPEVFFEAGTLILHADTGMKMKLIEYLLYWAKYGADGRIVHFDSFADARQKNDKFTIIYEMLDLVNSFEAEPDGYDYLRKTAMDLLPKNMNLAVMEPDELLGTLKGYVTEQPIKFQADFFSRYKSQMALVSDAVAAGAIGYDVKAQNWLGNDRGGKANTGHTFMDACTGNTDIVRKVKLYEHLKDNPEIYAEVRMLVNKFKES